MRVLTLVRRPEEIRAMALLAVREVIALLPAGAGAVSSARAFLEAARRADVELWFVTDDVRGPATLDAWRDGAGSEVLRSAGVLCRRLDTVKMLRPFVATIALGPWPRAGLPAEPESLIDLGVSCVWMGPSRAERDVLSAARDARAGGLRVVHPLPGGDLRRQLTDDHGESVLSALLDDVGTTLAVAVASEQTLESRSQTLIELRTILATRFSATTEQRQTESTSATAYDECAGVPIVCADLFRFPPPRSAGNRDGRSILKLDQAGAWPDAPATLTGYVHVPFCAKRCRFCFCSSVGLEGAGSNVLEALTDALCAETDMWSRAELIRGKPMRALYVGGGSPSVLTASQLGRFIAHARSSLTFAERPNITVEMAPSSTGIEKMIAAREAGATRVSIGVQSFSDSSLASIGSSHDGRAARRCIEQAREAGFDDIDVDLLFGLPGQEPDDIACDIDAAVSAGVTSAMLFPLDLSPSLVSWWATTDVDCRPLTATRYAMLWQAGDRAFERNGYLRFGHGFYTSAFRGFSGDPQRVARDVGAPYVYTSSGFDGQVALGPTAFGCVAGRQYRNESDPWRYIELVRAGRLPVQWYTEPGPPRARLAWHIMEQIASPGTVVLRELEDRFGADASSIAHTILRPMLSRGLMETSDVGYRITRRGAMWMANVDFEILGRAGVPAPAGQSGAA
jgi:coproporphyrinogen III oxidase-like Fe-S oxidoreductase